MSKRNSIIVILAITAIIIGGLLFFYFNSGKPTTQPGTTQNTTTGNLFGNTGANRVVNNTSTSTSGTSQNNTINSQSKFFQIYKNPTSGSVLFVNTSKNNIVRFIDRASGNVYEYAPGSQTNTVIRVTNTLIPKIQESVWSTAGDKVILRYIDGNSDSIVSFSGTVKPAINPGDTSGELVGSFIAADLKQLVTDPASGKAFGLLSKSDGSGSSGLLYNLDTNSKKQIFDSPVSLWNISWPKENIITFTTKPSYKDAGYLYFFNTQTSSLDKVIGGINGLSAVVSGDANLVVYSGTNNNSFKLSALNIKTKNVTDLGLQTLADKCVWSIKNHTILYCAVPKTIPGGSYPDDWYQGVASFSDDIWSVDTTSGTTKLIYQIGTNENADIDAFDMHISADDQYLVFSNKADLSLWMLQIN